MAEIDEDERYRLAVEALDPDRSTPMWRSPFGIQGTVAVGLGILALCMLIYRAITFVLTSLFH